MVKMNKSEIHSLLERNQKGLNLLENRVSEIKKRKEIEHSMENNMELAVEINSLTLIITELQNNASKVVNIMAETGSDIETVSKRVTETAREPDAQVPKPFTNKLENNASKSRKRKRDNEDDFDDFYVKTETDSAIEIIESDNEEENDTSDSKTHSPTHSHERIDTIDMLDFKVDKADKDERQNVKKMHLLNCDVCHERFTNKRTFRTHQISRHGGTHKCETCGSRFTSNAKLLKHTCEGNSRSAAPDIRLDFGKYAQKISMKNNQGQTLYKCTACKRKPCVAYHMKDHIRSKHTGETPYDCHICNKKFARVITRDDHIKLGRCAPM